MPSGSDADAGRRIVRVQPDIVSVTRQFDYAVPEAWTADGRAERVAPGALVRIDFHGRRTAGWVTAVDVEPTADVEIRPLAKFSSAGPPTEVIELGEWAAWRWAGRLPHFLRAASPPRMVTEIGPPIELPPLDAIDALAPAFSGLTLLRVTPGDDGSRLAQAACARGRTLIIVPTVSQRRHLARALREVGLPVAEYPEQWERSARGAVTVGTRVAAWAPIADLATIVVLDEHDAALKEERTPAWNARDVAIERARRRRIPCVLASPAPSLESLERAERRLVPERSAERNAWPLVEVVDMRTQDHPGLLSEELVPVVRGDGPIACILNRKGRSRLLGCANCGSVAACEACGAALTQPDDDALLCPVDGTSRPVVCAECGGLRMKLLRPGIARIAEELRALARRDVLEVSAETPAVDLAEFDLLVGTEALLHRLDRARAVAFLDFDQELSVPRIRAAEDAFALLALAARRLGGRDGHGRLLIQTRRPDHAVIDAARHGDADRVARPQRQVRQVFRQPPYGAWAIVGGPGGDDFVSALAGGVDVHRLGDEWRLSAPDHETLLDTITATPRPAERLRIEVDPLDR